MKEMAEFRVCEKYAIEFLSAEAGNGTKEILRSNRPYFTPVDSDLYKKIGQLAEYLRKRDNEPFYFG